MFTRSVGLQFVHRRYPYHFLFVPILSFTRGCVFSYIVHAFPALRRGSTIGVERLARKLHSDEKQKMARAICTHNSEYQILF